MSEEDRNPDVSDEQPEGSSPEEPLTSQEPTELETAEPVEPAPNPDVAESSPDFTGEIAAIHASLAEEEAAPEADQNEAAEQPEASGSEENYFTSDVVPEEGTIGENAVVPVIAEGPAEEEALESDEVPGVSMPERRSNLWVWVGLVAGILIALAAVAYAWWYTTARPITVPAVIGKLPAPAVQTLNDVGLRLGKVSELPTDAAPPGTVVEQTPVANATLKPGDSVSIVLAAAPKGAEVPDVVGQTAEEALATLSRERLTGKRIESYSATGTPGSVVSQLPTAGAELQPGAVVAIAVSKGPAPTQLRVPRVEGLREADAKALLDAEGLRSNVYRSYNASVAVGVVVTQSPTPDSLMPYDSVVQYLVSSGPGVSPVTVPSLTGLTKKDAEQKLKDRGLKADVKLVSSPSVAKDKVIAQMPPSGSTTAKSGVVGILVSRGAPTSGPVPGIIGLASDEASKTVRSAGFTPVFIEVVTAEHDPGRVFGQFPEPNISWMLRLPVIAVVARQ